MLSFSNNPLAEDLNFILKHAGPCLEQLREKKIFITGGTGFFGTWLLESFTWANRQLQLNAKATVLTRNIKSFRAKAPNLAMSNDVEFIIGDIRSFQYSPEKFDYIIHAATESGSALNENDPTELLDSIVEGTKNIIEMAVKTNCHKLLFTSSGAVYGPQPAELTNIPETFQGSVDPLIASSAYAEGKRVAELLSVLAESKYGLRTSIARCFTFIGPHLPLDSHFAIGNFIRDGLTGGPLKIAGDGTTRRSYFYTADLMIWLWTILFNGRSSTAYNVGSEDSISIKEAAECVSLALPTRPEITIAKEPDPKAAISQYVPSTKLAQSELGLIQRVTLQEALARTIDWHQRLKK
jgi:dTDP-glucose 4,6-dehydratase